MYLICAKDNAVKEMDLKFAEKTNCKLDFDEMPKYLRNSRNVIGCIGTCATTGTRPFSL